MLDVTEKKEPSEETTLGFGCECHLSGRVVSQVCTDVSEGKCNAGAQKEEKKIAKMFLQ